MAKYQVTREKYERYGSGGIQITNFQAENDVEALTKICDNCLYGCDEDLEYTKDELITKIENESGDGADYILVIKNLDSGEVLYEGPEFVEEEEDW